MAQGAPNAGLFKNTHYINKNHNNKQTSSCASAIEPLKALYDTVWQWMKYDEHGTNGPCAAFTFTFWAPPTMAYPPCASAVRVCPWWVPSPGRCDECDHRKPASAKNTSTSTLQKVTTCLSLQKPPKEGIFNSLETYEPAGFSRFNYSEG